jgi:hypothetical protein
LWLIFQGLVEAPYIDLTGFYIPKNEPIDNRDFEIDAFEVVEVWRAVINPDIKPANVVLGHAMDDHYPAFKIAKMIDYRLAWNDGRHDTGANKFYNIGTVGFNPPVSYKAITQNNIDMLSGTISSSLSKVPKYSNQHSEQRL